jgi:hypothetical protein
MRSFVGEDIARLVSGHLTIWIVAIGIVTAAAAAAAQTPDRSVRVSAAMLRTNASVYDVPEYPTESVAARHTGRVTVDVIVGPNTPTSPLARVQSTHVVEAPDTMMANAVLRVLNDARYMPVFDDDGIPERVKSQVAWDFRIASDQPQVVDPVAPAGRRRSPAELTALDVQIVDRAREKLASADRWNRKDTRQCPPKAKTVSLYCALELATLDVAGSFDHRGTVMDDARDAITDVSPNHPDYPHWLMDYNNDSTTTFGDIARVLEATRTRIAKHVHIP